MLADVHGESWREILIDLETANLAGWSMIPKVSIPESILSVSESESESADWNRFHLIFESIPKFS